MSPRWVAEHVVDGTVCFRIGRDAGDFVAEWPGLCELRSDRAGENVRFVPAEGADSRIVAKVRAGLGAALVRHLRGETSLHASAFARADRAIACLGPSGAGKSTLAAWACRERGASLLADDIVRITMTDDVAMAMPGEVEHWLDAASKRALGLSVDREEADGKTPLTASRLAVEPARLTALVSLSYGDYARLSLARVRGHRAMELLVPCLVRFIVDEPEVQVAEIARVERLLASAPLYELCAPRHPDSLPAAIDLLEGLR